MEKSQIKCHHVKRAAQGGAQTKPLESCFLTRLLPFNIWVLISPGWVLHVTWNYEWWVCTLHFVRGEAWSLWLTLWRLGNLLSTPCHLEMHSQYTHTKCTKVQVKVHQEKLYTYNCHLLSIFCSTFPLLKLVFVSRCIWNWNLAHEPEFVKEGLYIWAWFGWLVRRAYKAGRGAYKPLLWASHCATNGGGHISILPPSIALLCHPLVDRHPLFFHLLPYPPHIVQLCNNNIFLVYLYLNCLK